MTTAPLWLASASPRRRRMLEEAGLPMRVRPSDIDDGTLRPGRVAPSDWVMALAYLKGRRVADELGDCGDAGDGGLVLSADTVCVCDDAILGQPADADAARRMIRSLAGRQHVTMTGVCLLDLHDGRRHLFVDSAAVRVGVVEDDRIDRYIDSGDWRGKAGGYNLADRIADGWPIECDGDPDTVMGLPMRRLPAWMDAARGADA